MQLPDPLISILDKHRKRCESIDGFRNDYKICGCIKALRDTSVQTADSAGIKTIHIHDYRRSHASLLANKAINMQEIARD